MTSTLSETDRPATPPAFQQVSLARKAKNTYGADKAPVTSVVDLGANPVAGVSLTRSGAGLQDNVERDALGLGIAP